MNKNLIHKHNSVRKINIFRIKAKENTESTFLSIVSS